ncbi:hypothetical protein GCG54_00011475 [Colletotrichum gloeosporioides]|uniref:Uncharacterized protein n=1 Tax=Colletotrichum gloeosporioides TaxID=474922 RepID=A0A8H4CSM8_COLGL|nr:uncharacterized protein GCG54_00011475 [Colletotrichum gloeosporioides]KAF3809279.1 hypothetical protein GCG54_00011475 [Colletotrichum gloeosporioides]
MDWPTTHPPRAYQPEEITAQEFKPALEISLRNYYDAEHTQHYNRVIVLTFCWDIDYSHRGRLGHWTSQLGDTFQHLYGYEVLHTLIPAFAPNPHGIVSDVVRNTLYGTPAQPWLGKDALVIIYYVGHGKLAAHGLRSTTSTHRLLPFPRCPSVYFTNIRRELTDNAEPDVLMLLENPHAGGAGAIGPGKEIIAASVPDHLACADGWRSFSACLVHHLRLAASNKHILTMPQLYSRLATKCFTFDVHGEAELASIPIHIQQHCNTPRVPIYLGPILPAIWSIVLSELASALLFSRLDGGDRLMLKRAYPAVSGTEILFRATFDVWCGLRGCPAVNFITIMVNDEFARNIGPNPISHM